MKIKQHIYINYKTAFISFRDVKHKLDISLGIRPNMRFLTTESISRVKFFSTSYYITYLYCVQLSKFHKILYSFRGSILHNANIYVM